MKNHYTDGGPRVLIAGGGTGGHFFSGMAVGELVLKMHPQGQIIFVGTDKGIEARTTLPDSRMQLKLLASRGLKGKSLFHQMKGVIALVRSLFQSFRLLRKIQPQLVLGVGGFASFPPVAAAILLRPFYSWKVFVLEQNSSPGIANRVLSIFADRALSAFAAKGFEHCRLPIRARLEEASRSSRPCEWPPRSVLIFGGSQGAHALNLKWQAVYVELRRAYPEMKIVHLTGRADFESVQRFYGEDERVEVLPFTSEIEKYYANADLIIGRSGAMTVYEVLAFQRPTIFVPFPQATDDHQQKNAEAVQVKEWIVPQNEFTWERLRRLLAEEHPSIPRISKSSILLWEEILKSVLPAP